MPDHRFTCPRCGATVATVAPACPACRLARDSALWRGHAFRALVRRDRAVEYAVWLGVVAAAVLVSWLLLRAVPPAIGN